MDNLKVEMEKLKAENAQLKLQYENSCLKLENENLKKQQSRESNDFSDFYRKNHKLFENESLVLLKPN